jgi:hypothetical protein
MFPIDIAGRSYDTAMPREFHRLAAQAGAILALLGPA